MPNLTIGNETRGKWTFISGQEVEYDGLYTNVWGGRLPLVKGDRFPMHPDMGACRWTYAGPLGERYMEPAISGGAKRRGSY